METAADGDGPEDSDEAKLQPMKPLAKQQANQQPSSTGPRESRRLLDELLIAFHEACDVGEFDTAGEILSACETALNHEAPPGLDRRQDEERLAAAVETLWALRHAGR
jgi:hypothetical protein